jgi:hypothetical protein
LGLFNFSGRKGENDGNDCVDHNVVAPNLVDPIVVDRNILDDNLLHFTALVQSELSKFRTATSGTSNCSVQGGSRAVKVNNVVVSRQQYHCAHS